MKRFVVSLAAFAAALVVSLPAGATALTRTFVSSSGVDSNACTTAAPCATFARAYSLVAANGIVAALDPGKYGTLSILSSVTIEGNGWASITVPAGGIGIDIQALSGDNIILRGITLDGADSSGTQGIKFESGASLTVTGVTVRDMASGDGLDIFQQSTSLVTVAISDSAFIKIGGAGVGGACLSTGNVTMSLARTEISGGGYGLEALGYPAQCFVNVTVTDSVMANNSTGIYLEFSANVVLTKVQITGNATGLFASGGGSSAWLAESTVAGNTASYNFEEGTLYSYGNNYFADNGSPPNGSITSASKQ
jgi:nitrous oxidase accessory protein NosD